MTDRHNSVPLVVPQMGVVEEVVIIEWLVETHSVVTEGQEVVVVETEKAEVMLEAPAAGIIDIAVEVTDDEVAVGTTLAYIAS